MENKEEIFTIDFRALFAILWSNKWLLIAITFAFLASGIFYAFTAREEYISEGKILPEISSDGGNKLGGLAGLAALGGINLGSSTSGSDAIRADLYPDVVSSTPFFINLLQQKFVSKEGDSLAFEIYFNKVIEKDKEPSELQLELFKARPEGVIVLNQLTEGRIENLKKRISATYDTKSAVITISAKVPDPIIAAQITRFTMKYLTTYITEYRTEKLKQEVDFLERKVAAARGDFYKDQTRKAIYADQFAAPTIRLQAADIKRERLESEYKMSAGVYNELLKKLEEAKIKLQEETPIFQILDPPLARNEPVEPKKLLVVLFSLIVGLAIAFFTVLLKNKNYNKIVNA